MLLVCKEKPKTNEIDDLQGGMGTSEKSILTLCSPVVVPKLQCASELGDSGEMVRELSGGTLGDGLPSSIRNPVG